MSILVAVLPERFRVTFTANVNLYHVTKFYPNWCFAIHYFYPKISRLTLVLSITVFLAFFMQNVVYFEKFST